MEAISGWNHPRDRVRLLLFDFPLPGSSAHNRMGDGALGRVGEAPKRGHGDTVHGRMGEWEWNRRGDTGKRGRGQKAGSLREPEGRLVHRSLLSSEALAKGDGGGGSNLSHLRPLQS